MEDYWKLTDTKLIDEYKLPSEVKSIPKDAPINLVENLLNHRVTFDLYELALYIINPDKDHTDLLDIVGLRNMAAAIIERRDPATLWNFINCLGDLSFMNEFKEVIMTAYNDSPSWRSRRGHIERTIIQDIVNTLEWLGSASEYPTPINGSGIAKMGWC